MTEIIAPNSSLGIGNTKQSPACKNWFFTWNNYTKEDITILIAYLDPIALKYKFQEETGEQGTKHL